MIQQVTRSAPEQELEKAVCRHHWVIDAPTGPVSRGVCQLCDEVRVFKNYIDSAPWSEEPSSKPNAAGYTAAASSDDAEEFEEF